MKPFRYSFGKSATPALKALQNVIKHALAVPGAIAITSVLLAGPDRIYDYVTDIDTAILYESIEKSLIKPDVYDTSSNQKAIINIPAGDANQNRAYKTETFTAIAEPEDITKPVNFADLSDEIMTTAVVAQHRLNEAMVRSSNPQAAQNAIKSLLVNFESYRDELKPLATFAFILAWSLIACISLAVETALNSRRERRA